MKTIVVHLSDGPGVDPCIKAALDLARRFEGRLIGVFAIPLMLNTYGGFESAEILPQFQKQFQSAAKRVTDRFRAECAAAGLSADVHVVEGTLQSTLGEASLAADAVIVAQPKSPPDTVLEMEFPIQDLMLVSACPVLVIPRSGTFSSLGSRVLVAWNNTRESSRAVRDALPFLTRAEAVTVLTVNPDPADPIPGENIARYLSQYGVKAELASVEAQDVAVVETLLKAATGIGADLVVMGAWGHSRLRELVLGGATRDILRRQPIPVIMSH